MVRAPTNTDILMVTLLLHSLRGSGSAADSDAPAVLVPAHSVLALVKRCCPSTLTVTYWLDGCAGKRIRVNNRIQRLLHLGQLNVRSGVDIYVEEWYMVIMNHQSWVDILVLQRVFHRRIPFWCLKG